MYDPLAYMRLDAAAQRALNVFPEASRADGDGVTTGGSQGFSLQALLARGKTAMSKRLVKVEAGG